jgi:cytochrome c-type biogenesis protein CcmH
MSARVRASLWVLLAAAFAGLLAFGTLRESGPLSQQDRIDSISRRLACPTCSGESIYVSRAAAAESIYAEIARQVSDGQRNDDEIIAYIESRFGGQVLLVPRATGIDAVVWALPVAVFVASLAVLGMAFARWRRREQSGPSNADRQLVNDALTNEAGKES